MAKARRTTQEILSAKADPSSADKDRVRARIAEEMMDNFDEQLELEIDDDRLDELVAETSHRTDTLDRRLYFRELLRLQGELVKLQDWVSSTPKSRSSSSSKAATRQGKAA
jgi:hypothetical protein